MNKKQNTKKYNNKKYNFKHKEQESRILKDSNNDVAWYGKHPQLLKDAASISFNSIYGEPLSILDPGTNVTESIAATPIPGIMRIGYVPYIGVSQDTGSAVNNTARLLYGFVRHANSGSRNYESADLMMYCIAMGNAYVYYAEMVRLYGILRTYSVLNRYLGETLVRAMGYNYTDLMQNLASLRYYINSYALRINSFATPKEFSFYDRYTMLPLHVFKDADNDKSALYVFTPEYYGLFDGTTSESGSMIKFYAADRDEMGLTSVIAIGEKIITSLTTNEDIGIMSGDILKAFGKENLRQLREIPEDYSTIPVYDQAVLGQIHNMEFFKVDNRTIDIKQDPSLQSIIATPKAMWRFNSSEQANIAYPFVNMESRANFIIDTGIDNPGPELVMEISRLKQRVGSPTHDENENYVILAPYTTIGTELVLHTTICTRDVTSSMPWMERLEQFIVTGEDLDSTQQELVNFNALKWPFDWAPITYEINLTDGDDYIAYPFGELFNFTVTSTELVDKLNSAALLSLFYIPGLATVV